MRVVIAHDFTEAYGGAERVVALVARRYPQAPVWSILGRPEVAERMGLSERINNLLPDWEPLLRHYRGLTPLYPAILRVRRLPEADVLLTFSYAFAHRFRTVNHAPQVCYCFSPLRFAWTMTEAYGGELRGGPLAAWALKALAALMRAADRRASRGVTRYVAESRYVAAQIERFYGREAEIVHPPVDTERFHPGLPGHDGYYLFCGRLVEAYKRPSLAVRAFAGLSHRLLVAGDGPALDDLRAIASPNVEFVGELGDSELVPLMQRCAAVVFPSRDDFGMIPVEVMACGRPVLAYGAGGALETVVPGATGELFAEQTVEAVRGAVLAFDPDAYDPAAIRSHAEGWGAERFRDAIARILSETVEATRT
jgi:glycosyltransferase involved in cell wall biosynthesis